MPDCFVKVGAAAVVVFVGEEVGLFTFLAGFGFVSLSPAFPSVQIAPPRCRSARTCAHHGAHRRKE